LHLAAPPSLLEVSPSRSLLPIPFPLRSRPRHARRGVRPGHGAATRLVRARLSSAPASPRPAPARRARRGTVPAPTRGWPRRGSAGWRGSAMAAGARPWRPARPPGILRSPLARGQPRRGRSSRGARLGHATPRPDSSFFPVATLAPASCAGPPWLLARGHGPAVASARCAAPPWLLACGRGPAVALARCAAPPGSAICSRGSPTTSWRGVPPGVLARMWQPARLARGGLHDAWQPVCDMFAAATRSRAQQRSAASFARSRSLFVRARGSAPAWLPVARSTVHGIAHG
jgi:hypothetical protein